MSDERIQAQVPAGGNDPIVDELLIRVTRLEADRKRWRGIAFLTFLLLLLVVAGGVVSTLGVGSLYWAAQKREELRQREMQAVYEQAEAARQQAQAAMQQQIAEAARLEALRAAAEKAERERQRNPNR